MDPYFVFSDVDGTIINKKSMFSFLKYYWRHSSNIGVLPAMLKYYGYLLNIYTGYARGKSREIINKKYYENFTDANLQEVFTLGNQWWRSVSCSKNIYNYHVIRELKSHQALGAKIVLVSGSMPACINPLAKEINADYCLLTSLEVDGEYYTGKLTGQPNINQGKKNKILEFLAKCTNSIDLDHCYAYGDHHTDLPMLEMVGHPVAVGKNKVLVEIARERGWKIIR